MNQNTSTQPNTPSLRFPQFSGEWEEKRLGEVASPPKYGMNAAAKEFDGENIYLRITDIDENNGKLRKDNLTSPNAVLENAYKLQHGDLLFTRTGASTGKTYLYENRDGNLYFAGFLIKFSIKKAIPYFVYLETLRVNYKKWVQSVSMRSGQPGINSKEYSNYKFRIPSLPDQQKIASFLESVDKWIENLRSQKEGLEKYKKGMLQKLFPKDGEKIPEVRFPGFDGDWDEKRLGEVLQQKQREIPKPDMPYLSIGIRSHFKGTFQKPDTDPKSNSMDKLFVVRENDFIVNITFAWEGALAVATKKDSGGLVSHRFPTYIFREDNVYPKFFQFLYPTSRMKYRLENISPGGAGRNRVLNRKDFLNLKIFLPSLPEQQKIAEFLASIDNLIKSKQKEIKKAEEWKRGLMQQLFI